MRSRPLRGSLIDTEVNFWPAMIDMLTSLLMFFLLIHFVQNNVNPASLAAEIARQKQQRFNAVFDREFAGDVARGRIARERLAFGGARPVDHLVAIAAVVPADRKSPVVAYCWM